MFRWVPQMIYRYWNLRSKSKFISFCCWLVESVVNFYFNIQKFLPEILFYRFFSIVFSFNIHIKFNTANIQQSEIVISLCMAHFFLTLIRIQCINCCVPFRTEKNMNILRVGILDDARMFDYTFIFMIDALTVSMLCVLCIVCGCFFWKHINFIFLWSGQQIS